MTSEREKEEEKQYFWLYKKITVFIQRINVNFCKFFIVHFMLIHMKLSATGMIFYSFSFNVHFGPFFRRYTTYVKGTYKLDEAQYTFSMFFSSWTLSISFHIYRSAQVPITYQHVTEQSL